MNRAVRKQGDQACDAPRRWRDPADGSWHVQITQGSAYVTADPHEVLTTVLGSCIAACIRDSQSGVGGMNHFLLAEGSGDDRDATRYGVNAMELLINGILAKGGLRSRLEAKLFGGANVIAGLSEVGSANARFAERFLADEGILLVGGDVGGIYPRRVQFWPVSGRARQRALPVAGGASLVEGELAAARENLKREQGPSHDLELF